MVHEELMEGALLGNEHVRTIVVFSSANSRDRKSASPSSSARTECVSRQCTSTLSSVLVVLNKAGEISAGHEKWRRGVVYLLKTQQPDGSWHVASRVKPVQEYFESGFPHGKDQFISAFATGWATEALLILLLSEET